MPRITLKDLPPDTKINQTQIVQILGGSYPLKYYEDELSSVGDDAQLANIDLQNYLQKQQQLMQMLSSISKATHDTAMAVIRKIG